MADLVSGVFHTVQGLVQSILAVLQSFIHVIYSLVHGAFAFAFGIIERIASFVGASVHFVISNIVILGLIALAFVIYNERSKGAKTGAPVGGKKKAM